MSSFSRNMAADDVRDELAEELEHAHWCNSNYPGKPGCDCLDYRLRQVDALLPVVDRIARKAAGKALRDAADEWNGYDRGPAPKHVPTYLRARAEAAAIVAAVNAAPAIIAELRDLRAKVAAVEALAEALDGSSAWATGGVARRIRQALGGS